MSYTLVFEDEDKNQLRTFLNTQEECFLECGDLNEDFYYRGHIVLDKDDLTKLIQVLNQILEEMP